MAASADLHESIYKLRTRLALGRRADEVYSASPRGAAPAAGLAPDAAPHSSVLATPASRHIGGRLTHQPSPSVLGAYERRLEMDVGLHGPLQPAPMATGSGRYTPRGVAPAGHPLVFSGAHQPLHNTEQQPRQHSTAAAGSGLVSAHAVLGGSSSGTGCSAGVGAILGAGKHATGMQVYGQTAPQPLSAKRPAGMDPMAVYRPLAVKTAAAADPLAAYQRSATPTAAAADSLAAYRPALVVKASAAAAASGSVAASQAQLRHMQQECQRIASCNSAAIASAAGMRASAQPSQHRLQQAQASPRPSPPLHQQVQQLLERQRHQQQDFSISAAFPGSKLSAAAAANGCGSKAGSHETVASHVVPAAAAAQGSNTGSPAAVSVRLGPVFDAVLVDSSTQQSSAAAAASPAAADQPPGGGPGSRRLLADEQTAQHALPVASSAMLLSRLNEMEAQVGTNAHTCLPACPASLLLAWSGCSPACSSCGAAGFGLLYLWARVCPCPPCCSCKWSAFAARTQLPAAQRCSNVARICGSGCSSK